MSSHFDTVSTYLICMACEERGEETTGKGRKKGGSEVGEMEGDTWWRWKNASEKTSARGELADGEFFGSQHSTKNIWNGPFNSTVLHSQPMPPFAYFISDEDGWWKSMSLRWAFYQGYAILQTPKTSLSRLCCRNINLSTQSLYSRGSSDVDLSAGRAMTGRPAGF